MFGVETPDEFQSPRNRVKCSDLAERKTVFYQIDGFNPLEIGSNVLMNEITAAFREADARFNPLEIGSNVLIFYKNRMEKRRAKKFQSPRNRVKCSDLS